MKHQKSGDKLELFSELRMQKREQLYLSLSELLPDIYLKICIFSSEGMIFSRVRSSFHRSYIYEGYDVFFVFFRQRIFRA